MATYLDQVQTAIIGKAIQFTDAAKAKTITVSLKFGKDGVFSSADSYLTPSIDRLTDRLKFGHTVAIPNNAGGRSFASNLKQIKIRVDSDEPLSDMGTGRVGYWTGNTPTVGDSLLRGFEAIRWDFRDILDLFKLPATDLVREVVEGHWTGNMVPGTVYKHPPHTITYDATGATIIIDVSGTAFAGGQTLNLDPVAQVPSSSFLEFVCADTNTGTVSSTITVPTGTEFVVAGISGWRNEDYYFSDGAMTFTKGASDTAMVCAKNGGAGTGESDLAAAFMAAMFYQVSPDVGANKTCKWDWRGTGTATNPPIVSIGFFQGIDTASPVRDTGGGQSTTTPPYTTSSLDIESGDYVLAWTGFYTDSERTVTTWTRLTLLDQCAYSGNCDGGWGYNDALTADDTVAVATITGGVDGGIIAIVIKPAAGEAAPAISVTETLVFAETLD